VRTRTRKSGRNRPQGFRSRDQGAKCFIFLLPRQRGLSATYPAPTSTILEIAHVNRFAHVYTPVKNFQFLRMGFSRSPKGPKYSTLGWGVCDRAAAQTAQCG